MSMPAPFPLADRIGTLPELDTTPFGLGEPSEARTVSIMHAGPEATLFARLARRGVSAFLQENGYESDDPGLVASEGAGNAVRHVLERSLAHSAAVGVLLFRELDLVELNFFDTDPGSIQKVQELIDGDASPVVAEDAGELLASLPDNFETGSIEFPSIHQGTTIMKRYAAKGPDGDPLLGVTSIKLNGKPIGKMVSIAIRLTPLAAQAPAIPS